MSADAGLLVGHYASSLHCGSLHYFIFTTFVVGLGVVTLKCALHCKHSLLIIIMLLSVCVGLITQVGNRLFLFALSIPLIVAS